ncbi:unnamed protein product [Adineta ricciae]|uniref:F-box domain-containing protein n=1 Tax=Adineta ricciae TaxID=249248 RepID=A0A816G5S3_ADIRI|nr:unnamed protein product [Adineta ricciae]CAF1669946.1 unnamed protein product [Adineta ricciae]
MPHLLSKLTSCVHRKTHHSKYIYPNLIDKNRKYFLLSRFELFPDEILLEIFQYIPLIDLFNTFTNLNYRFNFLLRSLQLGVDIHQNDSNNPNLLSALHFFAKQIQYIHVDRYPSLNLNIFPNLHSLIIYLPTTRQLLSINSIQMPKLRRLWLGILIEKDQKYLCQSLFGENQFTKLDFCNLFQINFNVTLNCFQNLATLRRLILTNCQIKDFIILLSFLPNLIQLNICICDVSTIYSHNLTNFSHENLRILKIEFVEKLSQLHILNCLISFVPYVQQFTLILTNLIQIQDYIYLKTILLEKFLQLKKFICSIDYYCQLTSNEMNNKFQKLRNQIPFYQTMIVIPCSIHQDQCVRKIWMNKTFIL